MIDQYWSDGRAGPKRGEIWKHYKGGLYRITEVGPWVGGFGLEEGVIVVAYRAMISRRAEPRSYFRTFEEFMGDVFVNDQLRRRFEHRDCDR